MQKPIVSHWNVTLEVVRYIKGTPGLGLVMSSRRDTHLVGYCDADWAICPNTRRSITGFLLKYGESLITWKSKKHNIVSRSSTEAEIVWVSNLYKELDMDLDTPTIVHCDCKAAIQIATNLVFHERTKHIEIDCYFIREKIQQGLIHSRYITTRDQ